MYTETLANRINQQDSDLLIERKMVEKIKKMVFFGL